MLYFDRVVAAHVKHCRRVEHISYESVSIHLAILVGGRGLSNKEIYSLETTS